MQARVLLVDDEERFLKTTTKLLSKKGLRIITAKNGIEALAVLSKEAIDVAVLDVMMPDMDGLEVLKIIKQQYPLTEVIMLTGHATADSAVDGLMAGACDYVIKPADVNELLEKIENAFSKCLHKKDLTGTNRTPVDPVSL